MKPYDVLRHTFSTVMYIIVLFFVLWGNNLLVNWGMHHWIGPFFDWFYRLTTFWKLMFIIVAGTTSLIIVFGLFMMVARIVGMVLSFIFIYNKASYYISILMVLANIVFAVISMRSFIAWNFWAVIIWIMLFWFVVQMNWAFVFKDRKEIDRQAGIVEPY
ncbi:MAG: hypothetical protein JSU01_23165 [Bacteroidetes bacterium]|nr:hypothetical protein [Bacteroidota bacterium]